ncbi:hypothetical protein [Planococcus ruber]|uniref:hypothetical protein n=1 Tax=Planococcus ruber TaxID=2027871 RepID=UPI001FEDB5DA|nr:hypothetical protein [Planococcus ruber]MCJ1908927.1 hypothetical protein [Planococcus ruber]
MADKKREEEKDKEEFTEMPNADLPDFEPEQDKEEQLKQFKKTANTGKEESEKE